MASISLKNVICRHNIGIKTGYSGSTVHIIVFFDPRDKETYIWKCTSGGLSWEEGITYSILANYEGNCRLSHVRLISYDRSVKGESEQEKITPDADVDQFDLIFG